MPRALVSVSDKTGLVPFAADLVRRGVTLVSTGGTARTLAAAGLPVTGVSEVTGFPEMLDGRVKTLHPAVHGGILARRRARPDDLAAIAAQGIQAVDLVVVNLYPFAQAAAKPDLPFDELIEEIDIGGPSLVRAAAKNFPDVLVVVDPADYGAVLEETRAPRRRPPAIPLRPRTKGVRAHGELRHDHRLDAVRRRGRRRGITCGGNRAPTGLPQVLGMSLHKVRDLRYGENPHQPAAWYATPVAPGLGGARVLQGKELSFTNLLDLDAAARIVLEFPEAGRGRGQAHQPVRRGDRRTTLSEAYVRARDADPPCRRSGASLASTAPSTRSPPRPSPRRSSSASSRPGPNPLRCRCWPPNPTCAWWWPTSPSFGAGAARDVDVRSILGAMLVQQRDRVLEAQVAVVGGRRRRVIGSSRRVETHADRRGVAGASVRVARVRARQVEHHSLCGRRPHARGGCRSDEPGRCRQGRGHEGERRR